MIIRLNAAMRRQRHDRERGAATLEAVGMYVVASVLAVAVLLAAVSFSPVVGDKFRQAICMVLSLGQGSCGSSVTSAADHEPTEPCVLSVNGHTGAFEGGIVLTVGGSEQFLVEKLNNGKFRVKRGTGVKLGPTAGVGQGFQVTWDGTTVGAGAKADATVAATFSQGEVYYADSLEEVNRLVKAHGEDVAKEAVSGGSLAGRVGVGIFNLAQKQFHLGNPLPPSGETYKEGGITIEGSAQAANMKHNAAVGVGVQGVLGIRRGTADGTSTTYFRAKLEGNLSANAWVKARLHPKEGISVGPTIEGKAEGKVEAIVEVERDSKGNITAVRSKAVLAGTAEAAAKAGPFNPSMDKGHYSESVVDLPIKDANDQAIAQRYLNALGMGPMGGFNHLPDGAKSYVPTLDRDAAQKAGEEFGQAARNRGFIRRMFYDDSKSSTYGANAGFDIRGFPVGGGVKVDTVDRKLTREEFHNGNEMVERTGCVGQ